MKTWWAVAFAVVLTFLSAGLLLLIARQPKGEPIRLAPAPTQAPLLIHITGAVAIPGVYALPVGARTQDALAAAGGVLPEADTGLINLAALLEDGQQIWVAWKPTDPVIPSKSELIPVQPEGDPSGTLLAPARPLNINIANQSELESLPGIGPVIAQRIIQYRQEFGPFEKIEEIQSVMGIGEGIFDQIKEQITVNQAP